MDLETMLFKLKVLLYNIFEREIDIEETRKRYINKFRKIGVKIGKNVDMYGVAIDTLFPFLVEIGNDCIITGGVKILAHDASLGMFIQKYKVGKVIIHDRVFIGMDAVIMPGVEIGTNVIIGANSVVTMSIPPDSVAAGCPARVICTLDKYVEKYENLSMVKKLRIIESPKLPLSNYDRKMFQDRVKKSFNLEEQSQKQFKGSETN